MPPPAIHPVRREIIENQLLAALDDKTKVAALLDREDLAILIQALQVSIRFAENTPAGTRTFVTRATSLLDDLLQLQKAAFP